MVTIKVVFVPALHGSLSNMASSTSFLSALQKNLVCGVLCRYAVRVGVHNGRTFVGPSYELTHLTTMDVPGWKVLQVRVFDDGNGLLLVSGRTQECAVQCEHCTVLPIEGS